MSLKLDSFFFLRYLVSSTALPSSSLIHFPASSILLLNPTSVFFSSVIISFSPVTSVWYFLFSASLLKFSVFSHFSSSSVGIFMTITLNSLSEKLLIFMPLKFFFKFFVVVCLLFFGGAVFNLAFCFEQIPLFPYFAWLSVCFYVLGETAFSPSLEVVSLCRRWTLWFNIALCPGCLSNLCDFLNNLMFSW